MRQPQEIKIKYKGKGYVVSATQIAYAYMYSEMLLSSDLSSTLATGRVWIVYHQVRHDWQKYESFLTHLTRYIHLVVGLDTIILEEQMSRV